MCFMCVGIIIRQRISTLAYHLTYSDTISPQKCGTAIGESQTVNEPSNSEWTLCVYTNIAMYHVPAYVLYTRRDLSIYNCSPVYTAYACVQLTVLYKHLHTRKWRLFLSAILTEMWILSWNRKRMNREKKKHTHIIPFKKKTLGLNSKCDMRSMFAPN